MFRNQLEKENWQQLGGCQESDWYHRKAGRLFGAEMVYQLVLLRMSQLSGF